MNELEAFWQPFIVNNIFRILAMLSIEIKNGEMMEAAKLSGSNSFLFRSVNL